LGIRSISQHWSFSISLCVVFLLVGGPSLWYSPPYLILLYKPSSLMECSQKWSQGGRRSLISWSSCNGHSQSSTLPTPFSTYLSLLFLSIKERVLADLLCSVPSAHCCLERFLDRGEVLNSGGHSKQVVFRGTSRSCKRYKPTLLTFAKEHA